MRVIQLAPAQWLVLDDRSEPRYLIVYAPLVHRATGETHMMARVEWWSHKREDRRVLVVLDGPSAAEAWCRAELERDHAARNELSAHLRSDPNLR